jgi:hypothetical protein
MDIMKYGLSVVALVAGLASLQVRADEQTKTNESTLKTEDLKEKNKTPGADVDDLITNAKMRAESGSKSKWSISSALSYNAGSVEKPFADSRPNIVGATGQTDYAALKGEVSGKYNLSAKHSLSAGVGVRWITPLASKKPTGFSGDKFDADNPYMIYQYLYKWAGIQSVLQVQPYVMTNSDLVKHGFQTQTVVSQNNIYEIGKLSVGLYTALIGSTFSKSGEFGKPGDDGYIADLRSIQSDYGFNIDPFLEYQLTDKIGLRTVSNLWNYEHIRNEHRPTTFYMDKVMQSVGVGISVTRDVFIYPNVQFIPDNIRADLTNVAVNTNINLF